MGESRDGDDLPNVRQILSRSERWVLAAFAVVATAGAYSAVKGHLQEEAMRRDILTRESAQRAALSPRAAHIVDQMDHYAADLAAPVYAGDTVDASLQGTEAAAKLFAQKGLYFRLPVEQAGSIDELHGAARRSRKDALASCLLTSVTHEAITDAACEPGSACMGDASGRLTNVRVLHRGLRPLSDSFEVSVKDALDGMRLAVLRAELDDRTPDEIEIARVAADTATYALLVADESPPGFDPPPNQPISTSIETLPHTARIAVVALDDGHVLLRLRRPVDALIGPTSEESAVRRQVQNCELGLEAVRTLTADARLSGIAKFKSD